MEKGTSNYRSHNGSRNAGHSETESHWGVEAILRVTGCNFEGRMRSARERHTNCACSVSLKCTPLVRKWLWFGALFRFSIGKDLGADNNN